MSEKKMNATIKAELVRLFPEDTDWTVTTVRQIDMAIAVMRATLIHFGCQEMLSEEHAEARQEFALAAADCYTAPVNYQRNQMVSAGIATEKPKEAKTNSVKRA